MAELLREANSRPFPILPSRKQSVRFGLETLMLPLIVHRPHALPL
jgi:hypothetical protein